MTIDHVEYRNLVSCARSDDRRAALMDSRVDPRSQVVETRLGRTSRLDVTHLQLSVCKLASGDT
jgi:hypothetical protein